MASTMAIAIILLIIAVHLVQQGGNGASGRKDR